MNLTRPSMRSFWRRRTQPAQAVSAVVDPADMGTCFGLELSLVPAPSVRTAEPARSEAPWWDRSEVRKSCGA
ncbi:hypothetical protein [Rubrivivax albus]|uniref:Uncharacterized protein n=1 Tax=Rubrivivax albus TaxID=2499835 RepID=A0A437JWB9_9BURK|nr:hypothetical protein [Rubrivivax albus]RVT51704.1 hypothetical protein ENE75_12905 [Rubrivivax albus]